MEERKITESESIEIITSMISRTKARLVKGSGNILLMWGYLHFFSRQSALPYFAVR